MPPAACPHCGLQVSNDGTLSGQTVACPNCSGQFVMPAPVLPVVSAAPPAPQIRTAIRGQHSTRTPQVFTFAIGCAAAIVISFLVLILICSGTLFFEEKGPSRDPIADAETFDNILKLDDPGGLLYQGAHYGGVRLVVTVSNAWHSMHYQVRLQKAQTLRNAWIRVHCPDDPGSGRIVLVDRNGNEVGGTGITGTVWVQER